MTHILMESAADFCVEMNITMLGKNSRSVHAVHGKRTYAPFLIRITAMVRQAIHESNLMDAFRR